MSSTVRVWDLPTRLFHWALVACVAGMFVAAYVPGSWIEWHARLGYVVFTLLLFRLVWGFVGGRWSRFSNFIYAPGSILNHLRGKAHPDHLIGHSPLGASSVFAMMLFLAVQIGTGLVGDDEISFTGPLNRFVSSTSGLTATWYHKQIGQWIIVGLVVLHILAILYYLLRKKNNLVGPMIDGDKVVDRQVVSSRDDTASRLGALSVFSLCAAFIYWLVNLAA